MVTVLDAASPLDEGGGRRWSRRAMTLAIAAIVVVTGGCGDSRGANQSEETVPRITPAPTVSTIPPTEPTTPPTTTTMASTAPLTAPPTPWPTSLRTDPPTNPPATNPPLNAPVALVTSPQTQTTTVQPTVPGPTPPTSTVVVTPATPRECSAASIGVDTGQLTITGLSCNAGWAVGLVNECPAGCEGRDVFHVTPSGWVHDGNFPAICAEGLTGSGMSIYTAATFTSNFCTGPPGPTEVIRPDSAGDRVVHLQTALVAEGYDISVDGTYGPRTQAAVRDFQGRHGLEVDGIAGPQTQAALGIGPTGQGPTTPSMATATPTTATPTTATPTTATPTTATPTTAATTPATVVGAGSPAECTAAAIGEDIGRPIELISACHAGWAIGQIKNCSHAPCPTVDVFHFTDQGWVRDRKAAAGCAEELHDAGMSAYTAGDFAPWCGVPNLPVQRLVIEPGSAGVAVTQLQIALVALGYSVSVDGTYGPSTEAAIRDFQSRNGLNVDGIAGPDTRTALGV